jgi:hypothetical protein
MGWGYLIVESTSINQLDWILLSHSHKSDSSPSGNSLHGGTSAYICRWVLVPTLDFPSNLPIFFSLLWKHSISRKANPRQRKGAGSLRAIPGLDIPGSLLSESPLAFKRSFNLPPNARKPIDALGFRFRSIIIYIIYKNASRWRLGWGACSPLAVEWKTYP